MPHFIRGVSLQIFVPFCPLHLTARLPVTTYSQCKRHFRSSTSKAKRANLPDARLGKLIRDEYSKIRDSYLRPKYPIVLAHGLLGFDELRLAGKIFPAVQYWRGIKDAFAMHGVEVFTAPVSPSGSIEQRAQQLLRGIETSVEGKFVNIIAHSMGGLDARYMISRLRPSRFKVMSLTSIATPHRGSSIADFVLDRIGDERLLQLYYVLDRLGFENGAFEQLTCRYMEREFNPNTPDVDDVRYFSYGAMFTPGIFSVFRQTHRLLEVEEGPNDGLVSVASSKWGGEDGYKGTLVGVSHLDLINWTNRLKWLVAEVAGKDRNFNAVAFYLDIADMLAKEGL